MDLTLDSSIESLQLFVGVPFESDDSLLLVGVTLDESTSDKVVLSSSTSKANLQDESLPIPRCVVVATSTPDSPVKEAQG